MEYNFRHSEPPPPKSVDDGYQRMPKELPSFTDSPPAGCRKAIEMAGAEMESKIFSYHLPPRGSIYVYPVGTS